MGERNTFGQTESIRAVRAISNEIWKCRTNGRALILNGEISDKSMHPIMERLDALIQTSNSAVIRIDSYGGNLELVRKLAERVEVYRRKKGFQFYTLADGRCASAAVGLLLVGDGDGILASSTARIEYHGSIEGLEFGPHLNPPRTKRGWKNLQRIRTIVDLPELEHISRRTGQPIAKVIRDWQKDRHFTADEAVEIGLIDGIFY